MILMISSCTNNEFCLYNKDTDCSVNKLYNEFNTKIHEELNKQINESGLSSTRSSEDSSLLNIFLQMNPEQLESFCSEYDSIEQEERQTTVLNQFIISYSAEDYTTLNNALKLYISNGGHNETLLNDICDEIPEYLVEGFVYMCASADNIASQEIWNWLDDSFKLENSLQISTFTSKSDIELYCRQAFWDKIRLIALASGSEYLIGLACGPTMPAVETLETISDIADAGAAAIDYYVCCKHAIS